MEEFSQSLDTSNYKLHKDNALFVVWKWTWMNEEIATEQDSDIDEEESYNGDDDDDDGLHSVNSSSITHSVVFKCMGCLKEFRYQEILALVSKKIKDGECVPVELRKEPNNPVDSRAIAFVCKLNDTWERIGYVASEALHAVHEAIRDEHIVTVQFQWVKYIVYFRNQGWYAGIMITKKSEWPLVEITRTRYS